MKLFARTFLRRSGWCALAAVAVTFTIAVPSSAQNGPPIVRSVQIDYVGPQTISRERVLAQIRTKVGQPYSDVVVEQDIRSLYETGTVQNVRIFGQPEGNGVKVMVVIQTRAIVNEIEIDGAQRISAKALRKKIDLKINGPLN